MSTRKLKDAARGLTAVLLSLASGAALADWELNMPRGVTEISNQVYELHMLIFWICVAIGVVVFGGMIWSIIHHRKAKGVQPAKFHHNTLVEIIWTIVPFVILIVMAVPAARVLIEMEDYSESDLTVKITGYQWKWRYDYLFEDSSRNFGFFSSLDPASNAARQLDSGVDPATIDNYLLDVDNPLVVPVGKKVHLLLTSADVIHAWWVPALGGKKDAVPGFINDWWFKAEEEGVYRGQCAELCGRDHGFMPVVVKVVSQAEYDAWVEERTGGARQAEAAATAAADKTWTREELMARGEEVYNSMCVACHGANGEGNPALNAPAIAGGQISTGDLAAHINIVLNGKPGTAMAPFGPQLPDADLAAVITYERNAFGNNTGDVVQPADIKAAR